jgi:hypothetical protein
MQVHQKSLQLSKNLDADLTQICWPVIMKSTVIKRTPNLVTWHTAPAIPGSCFQSFGPQVIYFSACIIALLEDWNHLEERTLLFRKVKKEAQQSSSPHPHPSRHEAFQNIDKLESPRTIRNQGGLKVHFSSSSKYTTIVLKSASPQNSRLRFHQNAMLISICRDFSGYSREG